MIIHTGPIKSCDYVPIDSIIVHKDINITNYINLADYEQLEQPLYIR